MTNTPIGFFSPLTFAGKRRRTAGNSGAVPSLPRTWGHLGYQALPQEFEGDILQLKRNKDLSYGFRTRLANEGDDTLKGLVQTLTDYYSGAERETMLARLKGQLSKPLPVTLPVTSTEPTESMDPVVRFNIFRLPTEIQERILAYKLAQHPEIWQETMEAVFKRPSPAKLSKSELRDFHLISAHGDSLEQPFRSGGNILAEATRRVHFRPVFEHVMQKSAQFLPVHHVDQLDLTPLDTAVVCGQKPAVEALLKKGAKISPASLKLAAIWGEPEILETLLKESDLNLPEEKITRYKARAKAQQQAILTLREDRTDLAQNLFNVTREDYWDAAQAQQMGQAPLDKRHFVNQFAALGKAGINLDQADEEAEYTALHCAAQFGHQGILNTLLQAEAGPDNRNAHQETPLHLAVKHGQLNAVKALLKAKANVNAEDDHGRTALHLAAKAGNQAIFDVLLDAGADIKKRDVHGATVLHYAAQGGQPNIVDKAIAAKIPVDRGGALDTSALMYAARAGHLGAVDRLLAAGADVNRERRLKGSRELKHRGTALHDAAAGGHLAVVNRLLEKGANIELRNYTGGTALHDAASAGSLPVVERLLKAGIPVDDPDRAGNTALHQAALYGHVAVMRRLIQAHADVNRVNRHGNPPLYQAVTGQRLDAVNALLIAGAQVDRWEKSDLGRKSIETPLHYAVEHGQLAMVNRLLQWGANVRLGPTLVKAIRNPDPQVFARLLKVHAPLDARDEDGFNVLHMAALSGQPQRIVALLKAGIPVDSLDLHKNNALHWAANCGSIEAVKTLVQAKVPVNQVNDKGETPLHKAVKHYHPNPALLILIEAGVPVNTPDNEGHTALYYAEAQHDLASAQILREHGAV